jgi:hypothetical protein
MNYKTRDNPGLEGRLEQPSLMIPFDDDWIYLKNVKQVDYGFVDTYRFKDGLLCIEYHQDIFKFRWGTKADYDGD